MNNELDNQLKFSIIVPTHNEGKMLLRCLNSLENQNYKNIEIIVIQNSATQETKDAAIKASQEYPNIRVFVTDEPGVSNARNIGLENATGDVIGFCDADDWYNPGIIKKVAEAFETDNQDIVICGFNLLEPDGKLQDILEGKNIMLSKEDFVIKVLADLKIAGSVCTKFFKSELIAESRFNEKIKIMEDGEFCVRTVKNYNAGSNELRIFYLNEVGYIYYRREDSVSYNYLKYNEDDRLGIDLALDTIENECQLTEKEKNAVGVRRAIETSSILVMYYQNGMLHEDQYRKLIYNCRQEFLENCNCVYMYSGADDNLLMSTFIISNQLCTVWK